MPSEAAENESSVVGRQSPVVSDWTSVPVATAGGDWHNEDDEYPGS
jgi:hypothetical protein